MKQTVDLHTVHRQFEAFGRASQFSRDAREALLDYHEEMERGTGEELEFDVIGWCCDFREADLDEIIEDYSIDMAGVDEDDRLAHVTEWLAERTSIVAVLDDAAIVFQQF